MLFHEFEKSQAEQAAAEQFSNFMDRGFALAVKNQFRHLSIRSLNNVICLSTRKGSVWGERMESNDERTLQYQCSFVRATVYLP